MIDFHCHLDLYPNPLQLLSVVERRCKLVVCVTTSPRAWKKTSEYFASTQNVYVALGIHPEIMHAKKDEIELMLEYIRYASCIGEIGIDGSPQNRRSMHMQTNVFESILFECKKFGGRVLSIHSRRASKNVLHIIEKVSSDSTPILHWFSGTQSEVQQASELGCWFSVNPQMLAGRKGRSLVSIMPLDRILPETDGPFTTHKGESYMPWEANFVYKSIAEVKDIPIEDCIRQIERNSNHILELIDPNASSLV